MEKKILMIAMLGLAMVACSGGGVAWGRTPSFDVTDYGATPDDETDDTQALQNAINAISAGGTVNLPRGTYIISSALSIPSDVTIRGEGMDQTILKMSAPSPGSSQMITNQNPTEGNTRIVLSDFTLDGDRANNHSDSSITGIAFSHVSNSRIQNVHIKATSQHGIDFGGEAASGDGGQNIDNHIANNVIEGYGRGAAGFGIDFVGGGRNNIIEGNTITSDQINVGIGIDDKSGFDMPSDPGEGNVIKNNTISGMAQGILIEASHRNRVEKNTITNTTTACILLAEGSFPPPIAEEPPTANRITGNRCNPVASATGIILLGWDNEALENVVTGGIQGIAVLDLSPDFGPNRDIRIAENQVRDTIQEGIIWVAGINGDISNNTIERAGGHGIYVSSFLRDVRNVSVVYNAVVNASQSSPGTSAGIAIVLSSNELENITIANNRITEKGTPTTGYGIYEYGGVLNLNVCNNTIRIKSRRLYNFSPRCTK